eukprot:gene13623-19507_t
MVTRDGLEAARQLRKSGLLEALSDLLSGSGGVISMTGSLDK